jgi:hypothetical protein
VVPNHRVSGKAVERDDTDLIDGQAVGQLQSEGIAHPTKTRLRLAVNQQAWVDDVKVVRQK